MNWAIPELILTKGKRYAKQNRVKGLLANQNEKVWSAAVIGSRIYTVVLDGTSREEDFCTCPYFYDHGYCKHTIAVEFALREKGLSRRMGENFVNKFQSDAPRYNEMVTNCFEDLSFNDLQGEKIQKLQLQYILQTQSIGEYPNENRVFLLQMKIGLVDATKRLMIKNIKEFFQAYHASESFSLNINNHFLLRKEAFSEEDRDILDQLEKIFRMYAMTGVEDFYINGKYDRKYMLLPRDFLLELVEKMEATENFLYQEERYGTKKMNFVEGLQLPFKISLQDDEAALTFPESEPILYESYQIAKYEDVFHLLTRDEMQAIMSMESALENIPGYTVMYPKEQVTSLFSRVVPQLGRIGEISVDSELTDKLVYGNLVTNIFIKLKQDKIDIRLDFDYSGNVFSTDPRKNVLLDKEQWIVRENTKEQRVKEVLTKFHFTPTKTGYEKEMPEGLSLFHFFTVELAELRKQGKIFITKKLSALFREAENYEPKIEIKENGSWLDVHFDFSGIQEEEIDTVLQAMLAKERFVLLKDGTMLSFESEEVQEVAGILNEFRHHTKIKNGKFSISRVQSVSLMERLKDEKGVAFSRTIEQMTGDLANPKNFAVAIPKTLQATLRQYQVEGFQWLKMLHHYGLGGVLADEMGLGKTVQAITYLLSEKEQGSETKTLIVAPASLTFNWLAEFKKFAPTLKVAVALGTKEERVAQIEHSEKVDVLITSYASFRQDFECYDAKTFHTLILDEAQMVKNSATKISKSLKKLKVEQKFALSGTPIENNLEELWNIFQLILPGLFPSKQKYNKFTPAEISKIVTPFIMRREKKDVLSDLPEKIENNLYSPLSEEQKKIYLAYLAKMREQVQGITSLEFRERRMGILAGLTRLRQICDDPKLFMDDYKGTSGKLEQVKEILLQAKENNRRVLLFSQFTGMLTIIEKELSEAGLSTFYLRGSTKASDRLEMVNRFNEGEKDVFLISLKAGGTGLNLTGADTVILYDLWWNPAVEEQAAARAHRIGQENVVEVWRMIAQGTIEEKMNQLQQEKKELFQQVIQGEGQTSQSLTKEDIEMILSIGESE